jgi:hypothetical protein
MTFRGDSRGTAPRPIRGPLPPSARPLRAAIWVYLSPGHGACPRCRERVLIVGGDIALEPVPVLARMRCPQCEQIRDHGYQRRMRCWRCGDAGYLGERLPKRGVAIDPHGIARVFTGRRTDGEAVHRLHACPDD